MIVFNKTMTWSEIQDKAGSDYDAVPLHDYAISELLNIFGDANDVYNALYSDKRIDIKLEIIADRVTLQLIEAE